MEDDIRAKAERLAKRTEKANRAKQRNLVIYLAAEKRQAVVERDTLRNWEAYEQRRLELGEGERELLHTIGAFGRDPLAVNWIDANTAGAGAKRRASRDWEGSAEDIVFLSDDDEWVEDDRHGPALPPRQPEYTKQPSWGNPLPSSRPRPHRKSSTSWAESKSQRIRDRGMLERVCTGLPVTVLPPTRATARNKFDSGARYRAARRAWQAKQEARWARIAELRTEITAKLDDFVREIEEINHVRDRAAAVA